MASASTHGPAEADAKEPTLRDVQARGARIRFMEAGSGPPLFLLHDCLSSSQVFRACARELGKTFRVIAPDLPGFGGSEKPDPQRYAYGFDRFAESVCDSVAALGLGRVHLCGSGMGGGIALTVAARHAAIVHKLVLVNALVYPTDDHALERLGRTPLIGAVMFRQLMGPLLFRSYAQATLYAGALSLPKGRVEGLFADFDSPEGRQAAHATALAKADTRPLVAQLPRVSADTLVVWGRDDPLAPVEHGRQLARELRGRFDVLECGRCPPDELPQTFTKSVLRFLRPPAPAAKSRGHRPSPAP